MNHSPKPEQEVLSGINSSLKNWRSQAGHWLRFSIGASFLSGLFLIAQAWLLAKVVNAVIFDKSVLADVMPFMWGLLLIFLCRAALNRFAEQIAFKAALQVKLFLRQKLYQHIRQLGPAWLSQQRSGEVVNTLSDGIEALEAYYSRYLPAMSLMLWIPLAILVFVAGSDWVSALVMVVTAPLIPVFMILIGKGAEKYNQQQWQTLARMSAHFLDVIQGLTTLKLFNASRQEARLVAQISDRYRQQTMKVLRIAFLSAFMLEFLATISIALVAVFIGFRLFWGEMDFFYGFFVLLLAPEFYLPLRNMGTQYHARMEAIGAAESMVEILNQPLPEYGQSAAKTGDALVIPDLRQQPLHLDQLSYCYPDGRQALSDVSLTIQPGETIALVGASGAGKSTLVHILLGFLPVASGQVRVGDLSLNAFDMQDWRKQLAWVPQQPQLFSGTVADNIRLGDPQADISSIETAAKQAGAHDFIQALPEAYNTLVGEAGRGLSGGQLQRLALARAFLRDAPLVILDEATAHLDGETERLLQQGIDTLADGRTVIMIAHRLQTVERADRIVVMEQGRIVAIGTHTDLLQTSEAYQQMVRSYVGEA
uniref:Transport ATP-binding protein CydD n=1 Tax=uncultured Thiotrichaceae bacterium TaxID=298394 RepID=A0A6S6T002_9GAMM|nr:MAG: Transport ATP-binding protein CydD [uncultured Thiotrichaceae bacterium]